nr:relaxase domain-containing protein [Erythrobacter insulae]
MTQDKDGKWRALRNDKLWQHNTLLNAMTMARFRIEAEKLGYRIGEFGKHGNFEAKGIDRDAVMAFSTRRQEVLEARRGGGLEAGVVAALATRQAKQSGVDRGALMAQWEGQAWDHGLDLEGMVRDAKLRSHELTVAAAKRANDRPSMLERGKAMIRHYVGNAPMRRRLSALLMAAVIVCGVLGIVGLFEFKGTRPFEIFSISSPERIRCMVGFNDPFLSRSSNAPKLVRPVLFKDVLIGKLAVKQNHIGFVEPYFGPVVWRHLTSDLKHYFFPSFDVSKPVSAPQSAVSDFVFTKVSYKLDGHAACGGISDISNSDFGDREPTRLIRLLAGHRILKNFIDKFGASVFTKEIVRGPSFFGSILSLTPSLPNQINADPAEGDAKDCHSAHNPSPERHGLLAAEIILGLLLLAGSLFNLALAFGVIGSGPAFERDVILGVAGAVGLIGAGIALISASTYTEQRYESYSYQRCIV